MASMFCEMCGAARPAGDPVCPRCGQAYPESQMAPSAPSSSEQPVVSSAVHASEPVRAPAGARCAQHPESTAEFICARCGGFACAACKPAHPTAGLCVRCAGTGLVKATRGARFIANLLDNLLVGALPVAVIATSTFLSKKAGRANEPLHAVSIFLLLLVGIGVQLVAQLVWRQSIGKRLLGIRVVRKNGEPIELWRLVVLRNLALQVAARFFGIVGLVDVLFIFGKEQRCLHDLIADSIVIDARRS